MKHVKLFESFINEENSEELKEIIENFEYSGPIKGTDLHGGSFSEITKSSPELKEYFETYDMGVQDYESSEEYWSDEDKWGHVDEIAYGSYNEYLSDEGDIDSMDLAWAITSIHWAELLNYILREKPQEEIFDKFDKEYTPEIKEKLDKVWRWKK